VELVMAETQIDVRVEPGKSRKFHLQIVINAWTICRDLTDAIKDVATELGRATVASQWTVLVSWRGREKKIPPNCNVLELRNSWRNWDEIVLIAREKYRCSKETINGIKKAKKSRISSPNCRELIRKLHREKDKLQNLRLERAKSSLGFKSDPQRRCMQLIANLSVKHESLKSAKEMLSSEVSEMNHRAAKLTEQLTSLRRQSQAQKDSLTQENNEKDKDRKQRELNEAISSVQIELETEQKMSDIQEKNIMEAQDDVVSLQMALNLKEKELETIKEASENNLHTDDGYSKTVDIKRDRDGGDSFKRRFMSLVKKTKQQVEEEARVFKEAQKISDDPLSPLDTPDRSLSNGLSVSAVTDSNTLTHQRNKKTKEKKGILKKTKKDFNNGGKVSVKKVNFVAEALVLNAAGEGDIDLIKQCMAELGGYQITSSKGATCLHNAVCSGNLGVMEYFINMGHDVNAQDCEGWTPLHCAAGFTHLPAIHLLIQNGASLFLQTSEDLTPIDLVKEATMELADIDTNNCYHYLMDCMSGLGTIKNQKVYALFDYIATSPEELTFIKGECLTIIQRCEDSIGWWKAENAQGSIGFVPSTFLGLYPRKQILL
jgi:outer membrane murein-binding lipoprotein Lpp